MKYRETVITTTFTGRVIATRVRQDPRYPIVKQVFSDISEKDAREKLYLALKHDYSFEDKEWVIS